MTVDKNNKIYSGTFRHTLKSIQQCELCRHALPLPPRPVIQLNPNAPVLIIGQAPGLQAHNSSTPWNDPSGDRLRRWLGVTKAQFYNPEYFAIMPMGFCYPGKKHGGDAPPRPECAPAWHSKIMRLLNPQLTLLIGSYAQKYYLPQYTSLTEAVQSHHGESDICVLPHPSGRNNRWLKQNEDALDKQLCAINTILRKVL